MGKGIHYADGELVRAGFQLVGNVGIKGEIAAQMPDDSLAVYLYLRHLIDRAKMQADALALFIKTGRQGKDAGVIEGIGNVALPAGQRALRREGNFYGLAVCLPFAVQGKEAPYELVRAVEYFNLLDLVDVIIIGRGGGSLEDLWCFNDEALARAIYNSHIPVVSAVGHEIDFTICDFVADVRAATPSHAAEIVTPNCFELKNRIEYLYSSAKNTLLYQLSDHRARLNDFMTSKVLTDPMAIFDEKRMDLVDVTEKLYSAMNTKNKELRSDIQRISAQLSALNPLSVLSRGYGAVFNENKEVVKSVDQIKVNENITVKISDGDIMAKILSIKEKGEL
jgi:exodeoxyribonuclease VII large subunit